MGDRWEEAFRAHLRLLATTGKLPPDIVRIGQFWSEHPQVEIDAVALTGRREDAVLMGEAKWARSADAARIVRELEHKASTLPRLAPDVRYAVCARERILHSPPGTLTITAADIFG